MKKIGKMIRNNIKVVIGILIGLSFSCIGVIAATIASKDVSYTNNLSDVTNVQEAVEELYGKLHSKFYLPNLTENGTRYTGKNPNNYVSFNGELWRIIGIFDGKIRIIRNESIGEYAWNNVENNDWSGSSLYNYLNITYYNGLNTTYKNMVENATWRIDGWNDYRITTSLMYGYEESTLGKGSKTTTATGYIGLMNVSDYGYANSGCYGDSLTLYEYNNSTCTSTNWLYLGSIEWTITPNVSVASVVFDISGGGFVGDNNVTKTLAVRPSLYLKTGVTIIGGTGTSSDPYTISQ